MSSTRLLSAHRLDPNNPNRVISTTYVYDNPNSIKDAQNKGWIIDPIQKPQGIFTNTHGLKINHQNYIKKLKNAYNKKIANYRIEQNKKQNLKNLTETEKLAIFKQTVESILFDPNTADKTTRENYIKQAKNELGLTTNSTNNGNKPPRKTRCGDVGCSVMGGRRKTRRTKTRRTKTRRNRH